MMSPGPSPILRTVPILLLILTCAAVATVPAGVLASAQASGGAQSGEPGSAAAADAAAESTSSWGASLRRALWIFVLLSLAGLVLLIGTAFFLLWRAKQMVENAVTPNLPALERLVAKKRAKHPGLGPRRLAKKLIHRQARRAGLVGFATGVGGLPALPIAVPIDLAATIKLQSNLVHMLRMAHGDQPGGRRVGAEEVSEASLWLITTGGQELASASGALVRKLVVRLLSKSLLKFLPVVGGLVGFALNWASTQALGRLTLLWLEGQTGAPASSREDGHA